MLTWQTINNLEALILKESQWIQTHDKMRICSFLERHTFMIINTVVRDLLWNGKAENTLSWVKTMSHTFKALEFTTWENYFLPPWVPSCSDVWGWMTNEPWHSLWNRYCTSCFKKHLREGGDLSELVRVSLD